MKNKYLLFILSCVLISCQKEKNNTNSMDLLHAVRGTDPGIYDQQGRYVLLRGVNYNALGDYWQGNPALATTKQYEPSDIALMAKYGVNCIRLLFSWSKLEPERGVYNYDYIRQLQRAIEEAAKYNIYILLDMHQDAWGKYIATPTSVVCDHPNRGWDGAPEWATITDSTSTCTIDGGRESAPAVVHAFGNFWDNTNGIQDACIGAWQALVKETGRYSNVVGYDLINEPGLGYKPLGQESSKMGKYYDKLIKGIRSAENEARALKHIIFFEMSITWNGNALPFIPDANFTNDQNIIFAPHLYFEAISNELTIEQGYELVEGVSKLFGTNMFVGEWGFFGDPAIDVSKLKRFAIQEDKYLAGSTWWQWSQAPGDPHGISWDGTQYGDLSMALIELDKNGIFTGNTNDIYLNVLNRVRPIAICGKTKSLVSDPDNGTMQLDAKATTPGITTLWIPDRFGEPKISGENVLLKKLQKINGGYHAEIEVSNEYKLIVGY
jgi:endoglycosylceramidase